MGSTISRQLSTMRTEGGSEGDQNAEQGMQDAGLPEYFFVTVVFRGLEVRAWGLNSGLGFRV